MANTNTSEGTSYGMFERFLIWFLIPVVFTAVLLGVLFYILGFDVLGGVQRTLHNIPVIGSVIPAPAEKAAVKPVPGGETPTVSDKSLKQRDDTIAQLNAKISELEAKVQSGNQSTSDKDQQIKDLKATNTGLEEKLKTKTLTDEEYMKQIKDLASIYANMAPAKSAPILENLTLNESVLVLSMMTTADRVKILEKMDPKKAATVSIGLKDVVPLKDRELEALRERLALNVAAQDGGTVSRTDLGVTFSNMVPKSAAVLLAEMYAASPSKVVSILTAMDSGSRARVMSALSDLDKGKAAQITERLTK
jgi:flagellar motility protein MotE (MotC chaperone)